MVCRCVYKLLLMCAAEEIIHFTSSKAKGTDNPIGFICFRMCTFHHRFLYISTVCCSWPNLILFWVPQWGQGENGCLNIPPTKFRNDTPPI